MDVDNALSQKELEGVKQHLTDCTSCRQEHQELGALDMLLKSHYTFEPSDEYLDSFWPNVSEQLDGGLPGNQKSANGGGNQVHDEGEIVFKSSSAMQILSIPERRAPVVAPEPSEVSPPDSHPWRWPLAFVIATVCVTGAFIYHKKTSPSPLQNALSVNEPTSTISAPEGVRQDAAIQVAMATPVEAGVREVKDDPAVTKSNSPETESSSKAHRAKARHSEKVAGAQAKADTPDKTDPSAVQQPAPAVAKQEGPSGNRKPDELDSLINSALGSDNAKPKAKPTTDTPAVGAGSDLPAQLTMNQIQSAMRQITGHVQSCYDKFQVEGLAKVTFTILPAGTLTDAAIKGKFFGTDTGACVVKAVEKAQFPQFSGKPMKIPNYPFRLQ